MTERDFVNDNILTVLRAAFPNFHPQPGAEAIYQSLLGDIPAEELKLAVMACCAQPGRAFAPSIGEIRGAWLDLHVRAMNIPLPVEAWEQVMGEDMSKLHPLVRQALHAAGGWHWLHYGENFASNRARFLEFYEQLLERAKSDAVAIPQVRAYIANQNALLESGGGE